MLSKLTYLLPFKFSWVTCYWSTVCLVVAAYEACAKFLLSSHSDAVVRTTFQDLNPSLFVSWLCVVRKFYCFPFFVLPSNAYVMLYNCREIMFHSFPIWCNSILVLPFLFVKVIDPPSFDNFVQILKLLLTLSLSWSL